MIRNVIHPGFVLAIVGDVMADRKLREDGAGVILDFHDWPNVWSAGIDERRQRRLHRIRVDRVSAREIKAQARMQRALIQIGQEKRSPAPTRGNVDDWRRLPWETGLISRR